MGTGCGAAEARPGLGPGGRRFDPGHPDQIHPQRYIGVGLGLCVTDLTLSDENRDMRRQRTIYFNDARHYYLFVFEPPMTMEDAWRPVDEVAGTGVDTFVYGVSRVDGLYYPSKASTQFKHGEHGPDSPGFKQNAYWRTWHNMKSLEERGLDPLRVLIDRAHEKGMDFFASLRLSSYPTIDPAHEVKSGGRGWVHSEVRDFQREVLRELAVDYPTEGVELDFAAAPGGSPSHFRDENDAREVHPRRHRVGSGGRRDGAESTR